MIATTDESAPVYLRIAQELRRNIQDGVYTIGERVPTEETLSKRFGVNRHTLRRAIALLASEGLLRVDQGRGTFVADHAIRYPIGDRVRFSESLRAQGMEPSYEKLRIVEIPADDKIAARLEVAPGDTVAMTERLGLADGVPIKVASSFFPVTLFPDILQHLETYSSISRLFSDAYDCDHRRRSTIISAQKIAQDDARLLGIAYGNPILVAESVNVDQHGRVIEYGVTRFRSDRTELVIANNP